RFHQIELALGAREIALEISVRHTFEIPKGLIEVDAEAAVRGHRSQIVRGPAELDQVMLEYLDRLEARRRDRVELLGKRPRNRNGGNRLAHGATSPMRSARDRRSPTDSHRRRNRP